MPWSDVDKPDSGDWVDREKLKEDKWSDPKQYKKEWFYWFVSPWFQVGWFSFLDADYWGKKSKPIDDVWQEKEKPENGWEFI